VALPAAILRTGRTLAPRLGLPPEWLDGHEENGELDDEGLRLTEGSRLVAPVVTAQGRTERSLPLDDEGVAVLTAAASESHHLAAARDAGAGRSDASLERFVPFFIEGTVGASGVSVVPGLKPSSVRSEQRELYEEN
jgi:hypothetical protein